MNCWKTINISKQYGSQRLFILSLLTTLLTFIILYVSVTYLFMSTSLYDNYFYLLLIAIWLMHPLHKFIHLLPLLHLGERVKKTISFKYILFPIINIRIHDPIPKWLFFITLFAPLFGISVLLITGFILYPHYVHYLTILLAYHIGLCVPDFINAKNALFAPKNSFIEENDDGFEILVFNQGR